MPSGNALISQNGRLGTVTIEAGTATDNEIQELIDSFEDLSFAINGRRGQWRYRVIRKGGKPFRPKREQIWKRLLRKLKLM